MHSLIEQAIQAFQVQANLAVAATMAAYMKNKFVFWGIKSPERRAIGRALLKKHGLPPAADLPQIIHNGFGLDHREMHYFTVELAERYIKRVPQDFIEMVHFQVVTHSWWDTVDMVANKQAGGMVKRFPKLVEYMDRWVLDGNMWLQRTAILHQLKYKQDTDEERLFGYCLRCAESKEFFLQKAIGWALREYSKTAPETVVRFIENNPLAPLSKREGLKWLRNRGS